MMEDGTMPEDDGRLILRNEDLWSPEAKNFLSVASWGGLDDLAGAWSSGRSLAPC